MDQEPSYLTCYLAKCFGVGWVPQPNCTRTLPNWSFSLARGGIHYVGDWFPPLLQLHECICTKKLVPRKGLGVQSQQLCWACGAAGAAALGYEAMERSAKRQWYWLPRGSCLQKSWDNFASLVFVGLGSCLSLWEGKAWLLWAGCNGALHSLSASKGWPAAVALTS